MIYDVRTYDLQPGTTPTYMEAVGEVALPVFQSHGVKLAGWYYTEVGQLNQIVHIWAYDSIEDFQTKLPEVARDPRFANEYRPRIMDLIVAQRDNIMLAPDFFPGPSGRTQPPNTPFVYDMRIYQVKTAGLRQYMAAVREVGLPVRQSHGVRLAGWYYGEIGTLSQVIHIWAYEGMEDMDRKVQEVNSDPRWFKDYVPRVQPLLKTQVTAQRTQIMKGADFFLGPE